MDWGPHADYSSWVVTHGDPPLQLGDVLASVCSVRLERIVHEPSQGHRHLVVGVTIRTGEDPVDHVLIKNALVRAPGIGCRHLDVEVLLSHVRRLSSTLPRSSRSAA